MRYETNIEHREIDERVSRPNNTQGCRDELKETQSEADMSIETSITGIGFVVLNVVRPYRNL